MCTLKLSSLMAAGCTAGCRTNGDGMSSKPLTAAAVRKYAPAAKRRRIPDAGMRSLFLIVEPSGHKSWQMRFRVGGGRIGKLTLGPVDANGHEMQEEPAIGQPLTLAAARQLAARVHRERALGHDPIADHKAAKQRQQAAFIEVSSNSFGAAAKEFIEKHAMKKVRRWKEQARLLGFQPTANGLDAVAGGLAARWNDKPVGKIDGHDIHTLVAETRERGAPGLERRSEKPTDSRARAMMATLSSMYGWLLQHRRVESNPCVGVYRPEPLAARERVLTNDEIRWLWRACDGLGEPFAGIVKLLLLTGQRLNEVAGMRRDELSDDGASAIWNIPSSRTKNKRPHVVPLSPAARALIPDGEHALAFTTTGTTPPSGWSRAKHRLDALMSKAAQKERRDATIPPWRLHDLRRTCVTGMAELGIRPDVIELVVNHVSGHRSGVAGVYNRSELLPERKAALERWAAHVQGLASEQHDNVVTIRTRKQRP
jgi:integrase